MHNSQMNEVNAAGETSKNGREGERGQAITLFLGRRIGMYGGHQEDQNNG